MVGMAVATTVDSIEARNRLSMIPAVTRIIRLRDINIVPHKKLNQRFNTSRSLPGKGLVIYVLSGNPFKGESKVGRNSDNHTPNNRTLLMKQLILNLD